MTKELLTVLTRKGQITVPAELRKALGLRQGDKVVLSLHGKEARLTRAGSVVDRTAGIFRQSKPAPTAEQLRDDAERAISESAEERSGR